MVAHLFCFTCYAGSEGRDEEVNTASQLEDKTSTSSDADQELSKNEIVSDSKNHAGDSSEGDISAGEQPVCEGTAIRRRTFEATFLASSNKHKFSKATRNDILKFLETFIPKQNLPSCNYMFEKQLIEAMDIHYSQCEYRRGLFWVALSAHPMLLAFVFDEADSSCAKTADAS